MNHPRNLIRVIITAVLAAAVSFGLSESLLRLFFPQTLSPLLAWATLPGVAPGLVVPDDQYGWVLEPGFQGSFANNTSVSINSIGLRDREYSKKLDSEFRILSLGDSYAFGFGLELEDSYAKVLEKRLNERFPNVNLSVVSAGVAGYNTYHQIMEFERLLPIIEPDFIVTTFVAGNDVYENWVFEGQLEDRLQSRVGFFGRHSHLVRLYLRDTFAARFFASNRKKSHISHTLELLSQLAYRIEQQDLPFLILIIPARHQIRPEVHKGSMFLAKIGADGYLFRHNRLIVDGLSQRRIPYLDLFPVLKSHDDESWVYFDDDPHTNAWGDEIIGQAVFEHVAPEISICLSERGLLEEENFVVK